MSRDAAALFTGLARSHDRVFWLDGGGARPWSGRRSIIGALGDDDVSLTFHAETGEVRRHRSGRSTVVGEDVFAVLADEIAADGGDPDVSWVGYFGYAARPDLPAAVAADGPPDAVWMRCRSPMVVDHDAGGHAGAGRPARPPLAQPDAPASYRGAFEEVQAELRRGNSYEVNLTYREHVDSPVDPVATYLRLREANPAPYAGFLRHRTGEGSVALLSSSPERFVTVDRHRWMETRPIKGTTPRAQDAVEDERLRQLLAHDPKCRAENLMIVDLLRNDLSTVCAPGTVSVPALMEVESYATVHQLVSTVRGRLRDEVHTAAALRALFPAGSMTGAPKLRTMEIIERVEADPRGVYAGAFGWISGDGRADLGVVIRSLVAVPRGGGYRFTLGTGGGITVRSDVGMEYAESRWKADRLRQVLA